jgi:hypothetical protein
MCEFASLDRCAAYVAARTALIAVQRAAPEWPAALADRARHGAIGTLQLTTAAISQDRASAGRRRCVREALATALDVAATVDDARAIGCREAAVADVQRITGRTIALLAMLLHASTGDLPERAGHGRAQEPPMRDTRREIPRPR